MELKPGYKQTEIGVIPNDWSSGDIADLDPFITSGSRGWADYYADRGSAFLRITNLSRSSIHLNLSDLKYVELPLDDKEGRRTQLRDGDLLVSITADIGIIGLVDASIPKPAYINQHIALIRFDLEKADSKFLAHFLASEKSQKLFRAATDQGAKAGMNLSQVRRIKAIFPPLPEQHAIAAALLDTDALLNSLDRLLAKKRDIKQAVMQQLLTGKQRLPGFSEAWESQTIEQLEKSGTIKLSRGQVISKRDIESIPGSFPIYSSSVKNDGLFGRYGRFMFDEEMITWSVDGGGHFFYRGKHKFSVTNVCGFMRVDTTKLYYGFLAAQLQLLHSMLTFDYQDKAHPSVIRKAYTVLVPPLPEQAAIVGVLSDIDAEIDALTQRRDKTRAIKQGMRQELLTGRTRLA